MSTVIKVENLYKQYRLGEVNTGSLVQDLNRWWYQVRGKEDPYEKITIANQRDKKTNSDFVWALQDINFEVKQGEVLGIIGKNGAGKSTLLKILSKVTSPTRGEIKVRGRIASLLEVGTGFHPELTGRENIFLNGAILGMTKTEIRSKFDEIVAFSGVEQYIDTPVKRYSSGMYVRLAFAVAAHLEPEILIVDEVLAVGDAEFQKKCLGKMKDVSGEGRTVLFVSHNMESVEKICSSLLVMNNGEVKVQSENTKGEILKYLSGDNVNSKTTFYNTQERLDDDFQLHSIGLVSEFDTPHQNPLFFDKDAFIEIIGTIHKVDKALRIGYKILDTYENILFYSFNTDLCEDQLYCEGRIKYKSKLPLDVLNNGRYTIVPVIDIFHRRDIKLPSNALINIELIGNRSISIYYPNTRPGVLAPLINWQSKK